MFKSLLYYFVIIFILYFAIFMVGNSLFLSIFNAIFGETIGMIFGQIATTAATIAIFFYVVHTIKCNDTAEEKRYLAHMRDKEYDEEEDISSIKKDVLFISELIFAGAVWIWLTVVSKNLLNLLAIPAFCFFNRRSWSMAHKEWLEKRPKYKD